VIESRSVKWFVVVALFGIATFFVLNAKPARRHVAYVIAGVLAAPAIYVLLRVHPRVQPASQRSILGDVDAFLPRVPELARLFHEWGRSRGLREDHDPSQFLEWVWKNRDPIGADWRSMLPMVAATYGELIRKKDTRARWAIRRGDVVIEVPRRPWSRIRVAYVIHETVFLDI
jgi:hypothetical protein